LEPPFVGLPTAQQLEQLVARVASAGKEMVREEEGKMRTEQLLLEGETHLDTGNINGAAQCFEQVLRTDKENAAAFAGLALVAMMEGNMEAATSVLQKVKSIKGHEQIPLAKRAIGSIELSKEIESLITEMKGESSGVT
jgi:thioredoxin-like negative regulator of GroEL